MAPLSPLASRSSFPFVAPDSNAPFRLFCFPYGGASASAFRDWPAALGPQWQVCAAQPPGRETRFGEPPHLRMEARVDELAAHLEPLLDRPFAFFGHSLGALVAFELARRLSDLGLPTPRLLAVSGLPAPQLLTPRRPALHTLSDDALLEAVSRLGGLPPEVLRIPLLRELALPQLRADFELFETWRFREDEALPLPLAVFSGREDSEAPVGKLAAWQEHTRASFTLDLFEGGHFYLHPQRAALVAGLQRRWAGLPGEAPER